MKGKISLFPFLIFVSIEIVVLLIILVSKADSVNPIWERNLKKIWLIENSSGLDGSLIICYLREPICEENGFKWAFDLTGKSDGELVLIAESETQRNQLLGKFEAQRTDLDYLVIGSIAYKSGDRASAIEIWKKIPRSGDLFLYYAETDLLTKRKIEYSYLATKISPSPKAYYLLGMALSEDNQINAAINSFKIIFRLKDHRRYQEFLPLAMLQIGHQYRRLNQIELAAEAYNKALVIRPDLPEAIAGLADFDYGEGKFVEAIERLDAGILLVPQNIQMRLWKAKFLYGEGDLESAKDVLLDLTEMSPEYPTGWLMLGDVAIDQDDIMLAKSAYSVYLELVPDDESVKEKLRNLK